VQEHARTAKIDLTPEQKRLMQLVLALSREVEVLREDNLQLRAAVGIYRELLKSTPANSLNQATGVRSTARL